MSAAAVAAERTPSIDVSGLRSPDQARRGAVGASIREACLDAGFFYAEGHGVSEALCAEVMRRSAEFFALPAAEKLRVDIAGSTSYRGYEPLRRQTLDPGTAPDIKESFLIGTELPGGVALQGDTFGYGANQWPDLPAWRETMEAYMAAMLELGAMLLRGIALSLALPDDAFDGFCAPPVIAGLRLLRYPPHPPDAAPHETGAGAHTDWGGVSMLLQDDAGGLERWDERLGWLPVPPRPGAFVVNLGDMLARWTNDRYHSTRHRVINRANRERHSVAFFYDGRGDHQIACLPVCLEPGEEPRYAPTTSSGHLREMYRRTYASEPEA